MAATRINFPVLRNLRVERYQLFPGKDRKGLRHTFLPGVTVIAGINGLGKTTLLNLVLRCLTGPEEPRKFDPSRPVPKSREMSRGDITYFARRVGDHAVDAYVEATFSFGKKNARIKRRLSDLQIEGLWINGKAVHDRDSAIGPQQRFLQTSIASLSGVTSDYDFFFLIYAFAFSLEEKVSLIWHPDGQYQIFRILFLPEERSERLADLEVQALKLDSEYRNRRHQLNVRKAEISDSQVEQEDLPGLRADENRLQAELERIDSQLEDWPRELEQILSKEREDSELLEKSRLDLEEERRRFEGLLESYFAKAFPSLADSVKIILGQLYAQQKCLVCGNTRPKFPKQFERMARKALCPFCGDDTSKRKPVLLSKARVADVNASEERLTDLSRSQRQLADELNASAERKEGLYLERARLSEERRRCQLDLESVRSRLPLEQLELEEATVSIREEEEKLKVLRDEMISVKTLFENLLKKANDTFAIAQRQLTERFSFYASEFLAERCTLTWNPIRETLGQEGPFIEFPRFTVQMTSAFSQAAGIPRNDEGSVSESQKEFIDLAFRMALFDTVTAKGQPAMLVVETPEASLDLIFVPQAGSLLRKFAVGDPKHPNVVIATTNLNRENMLRSLLGLDKKASVKVKKEAHLRIINLLEEAAPNAALRKYGSQYRREFEKTLKS